jgi:hypothetical protein
MANYCRAGIKSLRGTGSLPTLQTLHGLLALFEKISYREPIFNDFSISGMMYNTNVSIKFTM